MRLCSGDYWDSKSRSRVTFEHGLFHQWASDFEEFTEGPCGNTTYALVELSNGQIVKASMDVKFEKK